MKNLFKSQIAYEILELFNSSKVSKLYLSEIATAISKNDANVSRELDDLIKEKIIKREKVGNKKYYSLNSNYKVLPELKALLSKSHEQNIDTIFKREWLMAEEIVNANPWFMSIPFRCFTNQFVHPGGRAYKYLASIYQDYHLWFYYDKQDTYEIGEHLVDKFLNDLNFMEDVNTKIRFFADKLNTFSKKIPESGLDKQNKETLWKYHQDHEDIHTDYYRYGWIPAAADMFGNNLTNRGKKILKDMGVKDDKIEEYLSLLTEPEKSSLLQEEQDNLTKIGIMVQKNKEQLAVFKELFRKFKEEDVKFFGLYTHSKEYEEKFSEIVRTIKNKIIPEIMTKIEEHYHKYYYTKYLYTEEQGVYSFEHYLKELVRNVNGEESLEASLKEREKDVEKKKKERLNLIKKLDLSKDNIRFFSAWGDFMITKIDRRYAQLFALYKTTFFLEEIASRIGVTLKELRFMKSSEIKNALFHNIVDQNEIKKRVEYCLYYTTKNEEEYFSGDEAKRIVEKYIYKKEELGVLELHGQCGCRGHAKGYVKIVNVISDMVKVNEGDILVSISTQPDLLPAMKKAAAFVTDQGGVTSHAAIVAREMRRPCVIATKIATQVLKDGDLVEVDADRGIVKIVR